MGWQDQAHTASAAPASTASGGTVSAGTATAAHSDSSGGEGEGGEREVVGRARRAAAQQAPARSGPPRRLPADIRRELEAIQQRQQQGQSASCGMALPPLPAPRWQQGRSARPHVCLALPRAHRRGAQRRQRGGDCSTAEIAAPAALQVPSTTSAPA